jgi:predicted RNA binding protein YcfA (HicA-like mRNA interferase family)
MTSYTPDVITMLLANGCHFVRHGKGDHDIWFSPVTKRHFVVDAKILSRHTANAVMKQAGIAHKF